MSQSYRPNNNNNMLAEPKKKHIVFQFSLDIYSEFKLTCCCNQTVLALLV